MSNHTNDERKKSVDDFKMRLHSDDKPTHAKGVRYFITEFEGISEDFEFEEIDEIDTQILVIKFFEQRENFDSIGQLTINKQFITNFSMII